MINIEEESLLSENIKMLKKILDTCKEIRAESEEWRSIMKVVKEKMTEFNGNLLSA